MSESLDRPTTVLLLVDEDGGETVAGRIDARRPDLALVDTLIRLQLRARRRGQRLVMRGAPDALHRLLDLLGLADVLTLEPCGEAELGEQLGIEEVVEPCDPPP